MKRLALPVLALVVTLAGCGGGDDDEAAPTTPETTAATTSAGTTSAEPSESGEAPASGTCVKDSDRLSGSSTVLWVEDSTVPETAADATPATTLTFTDDSTLSASTLSVEVNQVFAIDAGAITKIHAVIVGCAGGQTITKGQVGAFKITTAGTYEVTDELSSAELATITVG